MNPDFASYGVQNTGMVRARQRAGLTLEQVAKALGNNMRSRKISEYEFQEVQPSMKTLRRLAELYGCSVAELTGK